MLFTLALEEENLRSAAVARARSAAELLKRAEEVAELQGLILEQKADQRLDAVSVVPSTEEEPRTLDTVEARFFGHAWEDVPTSTTTARIRRPAWQGSRKKPMPMSLAGVQIGVWMRSHLRKAWGVDL
tara:strand:+ start:303 stop:686 length:384 start_codon:yes stop_codon:yes gene_type:complete